MAAYRVKREFQKFEELTTLVDGVRVALNQAYVHTTTGTAQHPPKTISVPLATQAQMKVLFEAGDPCIEQYEDVSGKNPLSDYVPENPFQGVTKERLGEVQGKKTTTAKNEYK